MKALILFFALTLPAHAYEQCWVAEEICMTEAELEMSVEDWDAAIEFDETINLLINQLWPGEYYIQPGE